MIPPVVFYLQQLVTQYTLHPANGTQAHRNGLIVGFMFLQIFGGHIGIPLVLLTVAFSKNVQRHPTLINFCVAWLMYATAFTLLAKILQAVLWEANRPRTTHPALLNPSCRYIRNHCHVRMRFTVTFKFWSSFDPARTAMAGLAFVLHVNDAPGPPRMARWRSILILSNPYMLFLVFSITMAIVRTSFIPGTVSRSRHFFYCSINGVIANAVPGASGIIMVTIVIFEVLIGLKLYRGRKALKSQNRVNQSGPPMHLFVRVEIFSAYSLLALIACIAFWASSGDDFPYLIQASLPTAAFLIFGTQRVSQKSIPSIYVSKTLLPKDLLRAWGITAAMAFISRPFSRFCSSKESLKATHVVGNSINLTRQDTRYSPHAIPGVLHIHIEKDMELV
ncbi:hypothetical protein FB451DRAFT_1166349 [Mycena latifolia]|nr:hypothetical protein FB451DRAFT_1166349 [Mycena latifolia]